MWHAVTGQSNLSVERSKISASHLFKDLEPLLMAQNEHLYYTAILKKLPNSSGRKFPKKG